jgi:hypothetical protein
MHSCSATECASKRPCRERAMHDATDAIFPAVQSGKPGGRRNIGGVRDARRSPRLPARSGARLKRCGTGADGPSGTRAAPAPDDGQGRVKALEWENRDSAGVGHAVGPPLLVLRLPSRSGSVTETFGCRAYAAAPCTPASSRSKNSTVVSETKLATNSGRPVMRRW